ncbi:lipocalin-like domain-containing protein [Burkholderia sp. JSH-S8]|nr:lipocalin-like domain-containing protein [Burkholderia sp. JSH-S8]
MSELIGAWSLEVSEFRLASGRITYPLGRNPMGRIIYTDNGYMSVILTIRQGAKIGLIPEAFWSNILSPKKMIAAIRLIRANFGLLSYSGRYFVDGNVVSHHVDLSSYPDFCGMNLMREVRCEEGRLIIENNSDSGSSRLIWSREI